ncbi:Leucyl aminopeptidase yscIV [Entomophthora muscae]|uniref:Leucyl aminopeptidase yscIV n=1 Tax=Entomophthora muscae TaxID=34485 RepID=A0ACC2UGH5_9FUNG|nr:Leucyl aminopeptidase yscIV [Entomophthora muscae]
MVPCQDTPSLKISYSASITVPGQLTALMSALSTGSEKLGDKTTFKFEQKNAIPSYLIALAVGNLASKAISDRIAVWCEPEMLEAAAYEFSDAEQFMKIAEELTCPYEWGRYDLLILPPSFPYGGMENPCISFITPTLLAGDKSAVDVIAHELSHSWTGNLVTNSNWENFWLNEGWTKFLERKIMGRMHGEATRQFSSIIGWKALKESVELFGADSPLTALCPKLENMNPDDAFSSIPYEKGYNFLYYLEQLLGGPEIFEPYMKAHIIHFAHQSIATDQWKEFLYRYMEKNHGQSKVELLNKVDWNTWLYAPGMPPVECNFDDSLSKACNQLAKKWLDSKDLSDFSSFNPAEFETLSTNQRVVFLDRLTDHPAFPIKAVQGMAGRYSVSTSNNCEIKLRWQLFCLKAGYEAIYPAVVDFVKSQGRMKYVRPLYRSLSQAPNGNELAKSTFLENKAFYHPIAAKLIVSI